MCRISRDADNREKAAPYPEFLSQRILSRPVSPRRGLIHDEYPRGLFIVIRCKLASFQNGYMKGFEIPRGHFGVVHLQRFMGVSHPHESLQVYHAEVAPRYFESLHIPILEGREFSPDDDEKAPRVLIVDQTAA